MILYAGSIFFEISILAFCWLNASMTRRLRLTICKALNILFGWFLRRLSRKFHVDGSQMLSPLWLCNLVDVWQCVRAVIQAQKREGCFRGSRRLRSSFCLLISRSLGAAGECWHSGPWRRTKHGNFDVHSPGPDHKRLLLVVD